TKDETGRWGGPSRKGRYRLNCGRKQSVVGIKEDSPLAARRPGAIVFRRRHPTILRAAEQDDQASVDFVRIGLADLLDGPIVRSIIHNYQFGISHRSRESQSAVDRTTHDLAALERRRND